jgi:aromatic ring hydroxylase
VGQPSLATALVARRAVVPSSRLDLQNAELRPLIDRFYRGSTRDAHDRVKLLAGLASARGWDLHLYDAKNVEGQAVSILAERADDVLHSPRATLGPPWAKNHRMALAATIVAS